ncbi:Pycsar system effector family protein [Kitasatospora sp. NPDC050543]|uniref:Pycsar system effector family protein n=1 Tax=Kitasatospora sp. NPDC050543 TaxID=3364054 RepID=UPI0037BA87C3
MSVPTVGTNGLPLPGLSGATTTVSTTAGLDAAWRIHGSLADWVGRVDVKASFALSLATAALVAITSVAQTVQISGAHSQRRQTATLVDLWVSAVLVAAALVFAIAAVAPRIGSRGEPDEWRHNVIYFGHLRYWSADELAAALAEQDLLPALSGQLVALSRIAWAKHVRVRTSLVLGGVGVTLAAAPAMMNSMV